MGRLADGSCKFYTKENPYIPTQNPYKVDNTAAYVNMGMNAFTGILGSILNGSKNTDGSDKTDVPKGESPRKIQKQIKTLLNKWDSNPNDKKVDANISDLELKLAQKHGELKNKAAEYEINYDDVQNKRADVENKKTKITKIDADIATKTEEIKNLGNNIESIDKEIGRYQNELYYKDENGKEVKNDKIEKKIKELEAQKQALVNEQSSKRKEIDKLNLEKDSLNTEINGINDEISKLDNSNLSTLDAINSDIDQMQADIATLQKLKSNYSDAKGEDAIKNLTNDETANITAAIKKYTNASAADKETCKKELMDSLACYYNQHCIGDNKTIDAFAKHLNFNLTQYKQPNVKA